MNRDINVLLRTSMNIDSPEWLDRLVTDRVVAVVENEPSSLRTKSRRPRDVAVLRATMVLIGKGWARATLLLTELVAHRPSLKRGA